MGGNNYMVITCGRARQFSAAPARDVPRLLRWAARKNYAAFKINRGRKFIFVDRGCGRSVISLFTRNARTISPPRIRKPAVVVVPRCKGPRVVGAHISSLSRRVSAIGLDGQRKSFLIKYARMTNLTPAEQIEVVKVVLSKLSFSDSKKTVLRVLIYNPTFSRAANRYIARNISDVGFSSNQRSILKLLARKRGLPARACYSR